MPLYAPAIVIKNLDDGKYVVNLIYDLSQAKLELHNFASTLEYIEQSIKNLTADIQTLERDLKAAYLEQKSLQSDLEQARAEESETESLIKEIAQNAPKIQAITQEINTIREKLSDLKVQRISLISRQKELLSIMPEPPTDLTVWCVDYTDDIPVGTLVRIILPSRFMISPDGFESYPPQIRMGKMDSEQDFIKANEGVEQYQWNPEAHDNDGIILQPILQTDLYKALFNLFFELPVTIKRYPFRYAVISAVDYGADTCDLTVISSKRFFGPDKELVSMDKENPHDRVVVVTDGDKPQEKFSETEEAALHHEGIPIEYMDCNASVFEKGDKVMIEYLPFANVPLRVVGFHHAPKPCLLRGLIATPSKFKKGKEESTHILHYRRDASSDYSTSYAKTEMNYGNISWHGLDKEKPVSVTWEGDSNGSVFKFARDQFGDLSTSLNNKLYHNGFKHDFPAFIIGGCFVRDKDDAPYLLAAGLEEEFTDSIQLYGFASYIPIRNFKIVFYQKKIHKYGKEDENPPVEVARFDTPQDEYKEMLKPWFEPTWNGNSFGGARTAFNALIDKNFIEFDLDCATEQPIATSSTDYLADFVHYHTNAFRKVITNALNRSGKVGQWLSFSPDGKRGELFTQNKKHTDLNREGLLSSFTFLGKCPSSFGGLYDVFVSPVLIFSGETLFLSQSYHSNMSFTFASRPTIGDDGIAFDIDLSISREYSDKDDVTRDLFYKAFTRSNDLVSCYFVQTRQKGAALYTPDPNNFWAPPPYYAGTYTRSYQIDVKHPDGDYEIDLGTESMSVAYWKKIADGDKKAVAREEEFCGHSPCYEYIPTKTGEIITSNYEYAALELYFADGERNGYYSYTDNAQKGRRFLTAFRPEKRTHILIGREMLEIQDKGQTINIQTANIPLQHPSGDYKSGTSPYISPRFVEPPYIEYGGYYGSYTYGPDCIFFDERYHLHVHPKIEWAISNNGDLMFTTMNSLSRNQVYDYRVLLNDVNLYTDYEQGKENVENRYNHLWYKDLKYFSYISDANLAALGQFEPDDESYKIADLGVV